MPNYPDSDRLLDRALNGATAAAGLQQTLMLRRDWLDDPDTLSLQAHYHLVEGDDDVRVRACVGAHELFLDEPVRLHAAAVSKPWGRELWLTGIEARGESGVHTNAGILPLSQYLALAPRRLTGGADPVLLKVLDPSPDPVLGDLYVEAHETKHEAYVVSHVDCAAWPDGRGAIRYGMNQSLRRRYGDDDVFRRAYLDAVQRYEAVRRAVDDGVTVGAGEEAGARAAVEAFTELRGLAAGDVVVVPTWLPHSLQHGVRVIEFQTPVFERYILSFDQKVLSQQHWDTAAAVSRIRLDAPPPSAVEPLAHGVERIAGLEDFQVWRITLDPGAAFTVPRHASHGLCVVLQGHVALGALTLGAEDAAFVPALAVRSKRALGRMTNRGADRAVVLLAAPDL